MTSISSTNAAIYPRDLFANWGANASIRSTDLDFRFREIDQNDSVLSPLICPLLGHSLMGSAPNKSLIERTFLCEYLKFTTDLELNHITKAASFIVSSHFPYCIDPMARSDAFLVYCDEVYHAKFTDDLFNHLAAELPETVTSILSSGNLDDIDDIISMQVENRRELANLFFTVISESIVTSSLSIAYKDPTLNWNVRAALHKHASDEWRHQKYFSYVCHAVWQDLSNRDRDIIGPLISKFVDLYLKRNMSRDKALLYACGLSMDESRLIVQESYTDDYVRKTWLSATEVTRKIFEPFIYIPPPC